MRSIRVAVPTGRVDAVRDILEEREFEYTVSPELRREEYEETVTFPVPTDAVEPTLTDLEEIGIHEDGITVVTDAEAVVAEGFEELQETYDEEIPEERISREELRTEAREFIPAASTYVLLSVISAVVATGGLLLDSPAVVVGSMVIAPLIGPAMATNVGTVLDDQSLFREGAKYQLLGVGVAVAGAAVFAFAVRTFFLVPPTIEVTSLEQVAGRLNPDLLSLVIALASGVAGARSLTSDISTALVGVMIAAALVPPIGAVGIGIAWLLPDVVVRAGLLVAVNVLAINLATLATLWYTGYHSSGWHYPDVARSVTQRRMLSLMAVVLVVAVVLSGLTLAAYQTGASTQAVQDDVTAVLDDPSYDDVRLLAVDVRRTDGFFRQRPTTVVVRVARPPGEPHPRLDDRIDARVDERVGRDVDTRVRVIMSRRAD